jgi:hypothetical protein
MRSVADELRRRSTRTVAGLSPEERMRLAFELGEDDLEAFRRKSGLDRVEAVRQLRRRRQSGRRPSKCMRALEE